MVVFKKKNHLEPNILSLKETIIAHGPLFELKMNF